MSDDYELVPRSEIFELKKQLEELKSQKGIVEAGAKEKIEITNKELFDTMNKLIEGINTMIAIFARAGEELSKSDDDDQMLRKRLDPITEKMDDIEDQNRKVARAILAVSDSVKNQFAQLSEDMDKKFQALATKTPTPPSTSPDPFGAPVGMPPPPVPPPSPPGGY